MQINSKFLLLKSVENGTTQKIYRYSCEKYKDLFMWRCSENEAKADVYRWFINFCDRAKGLSEMIEIDIIKKHNLDLIS